MKNITNTKDKEWIACFFIACFVSLLFYYTQMNSVYNKVDLYWFELGICLPFALPVYMLLRNHWEVKHDR